MNASSLAQRLPSLKAVRYELSRRSLATFVRQAWAIIEPNTPLLWNWHLDLICEHLECVTFGDTRSLAINIPPRYMKSILVTVMWPCWEWALDPSRRYLFASYSSELSTTHSLARRRILESPWYREGVEEHWGEPWALADDANLKTRYQNTAQGHMIATSVGGSATGEGGDRVIIDDPLKPTEAVSDVQRASSNRFWDETLSTRLNDKGRGAFVLVMQRLHEDDMTGHVLSEGGWTHLCLPAIAEADETITFPRSGRVHMRAAGELLWPERENAAQVALVKTRLGSYGFSGQYQQRPSPLEGGVFRRLWWKRGTPPATFNRIVQSWDLAFKGTSGSDFVAAFVIGEIGADKWLLDCVNARLDFVQTCEAIKDVSAKHPKAKAKIVEDKANGPAVISALERIVAGLIPVNPEGGKLSRAMAIQPEVEAGNWWIPDGAEWAHDFIEQAAAFPNASHDDMVDAFTQGGNWLATNKPRPSLGHVSKPRGM